VVARILLWNIFDSKTNLAELRENLPELGEDGAWIASDAQDRFGLVWFGEDLPDLSQVRGLIGKEPEVFEEYDVL
jgi:hypothetical protein